MASQMCSGELFLEAPSSKHLITKSKRSVDLQRPKSAGLYRQRRKTNNADDVPSLSLLVNMPENQHWDIGSIRHIREPSSASEGATPDSAVDSIFEHPSAVPADSPNSSVASPYPSFAVELEDTSPYVQPRKSKAVVETPYIAPLSVKKSPRTIEKSYIEQLTRPEYSVSCFQISIQRHRANSSTQLRAASAIENISAIESDNRLLLERAIAAEDAAQMLREKNKSLQHRIEYCVNLHRPNTASGKARAVSTGNLISSFNSTYKTSMQRIPRTPPLLQAPKTPPAYGRRRPTPLRLSQPHLSPTPVADRHSNASSAPGTHNPQTPTPSSKRHPSPRTLSHDLAPSSFASITFPANPHPYRRARPPPIRTSHSHRRLSAIGSPIPGSVNRHTVTYEGVPIFDKPAVQTISLAEARRREKPLPPMGPMSPSAIPGRVEIGLGIGYEDGGREEEVRKSRGFRVLFRWGRKSQTQVF